MEELEEIDSQYVEAVLFNIVQSYKKLFGEEYVNDMLKKKNIDKSILEAQYKAVSCIHEENSRSDDLYSIEKQSLFLSQMLNLLKIDEALDICKTLKPLNKELDSRKKIFETKYNDFLKIADNTSNMSEDDINDFNSKLFLKTLEYENILKSYEICKNIDTTINIVKNYKVKSENNMKILSGINQRVNYIRK